MVLYCPSWTFPILILLSICFQSTHPQIRRNQEKDNSNYFCLDGARHELSTAFRTGVVECSFYLNHPWHASDRATPSLDEKAAVFVTGHSASFFLLAYRIHRPVVCLASFGSGIHSSIRHDTLWASIPIIAITLFRVSAVVFERIHK